MRYGSIRRSRLPMSFSKDFANIHDFDYPRKVTPYPWDLPVDEEELIEAIRVLADVSSLGRQVFFLYDSSEMDFDAIGQYLGVTSESARTAFTEVSELLSARMERLVHGFLQRRIDRESAPNMLFSGVMTGKTATELIPVCYLVIYTRYFLSEDSIQDIASELGFPVEDVERGIEGVKKIFNWRMDRIAMRLLTLPEEVFIPDNMVEDIYRVHEIQNKAKSEQRVLQNVSPKEARSKIFSGNVQTVAAAASIAQVFTSITNFTRSNDWGWPTALMKFSAPFLWVISLLVSGHFCGTAFIYRVPTLEARRWLTKKLFWIYCLVFIAPICIWPIGEEITYRLRLSSEGQQRLTQFFVVLLFSGFFYFIHIISKARKQWKQFSNLDNLTQQQTDLFLSSSSFSPVKGADTLTFSKEPESSSSNESRSLIYWGFVWTTLILLSVIAYSVPLLILPRISNPARHTSLVVFVLIEVGAVLFHCGTFLLFRHYLKISKDNASFLRNPPIILIDSSSPEKKAALRFLFTLTPVFIHITMGIAHIAKRNTHPFLTICEIAFFALCWLTIGYWNMKKGKGAWTRAIVMCAIQFVIMFLLRDQVYRYL